MFVARSHNSTMYLRISDTGITVQAFCCQFVTATVTFLCTTTKIIYNLNNFQRIVIISHLSHLIVLILFITFNNRLTTFIQTKGVRYSLISCFLFTIPYHDYYFIIFSFNLFVFQGSPYGSPVTFSIR